MASARRSRARLILVAAGLASGAGFAAAVTLSWPFARGQGFLLAIAIAAMVCLVLGLSAYWVRGLAWSVALLGALFLIRLQLDPAAVSGWTAVAAGGLLLVAELGYWSFELDGASTIAAEGMRARALEVLLVCLAGGAIAELALDLAEALPVSGSWLLVVGVLAAAGPPAILLRLARRA